MLEKPLRPMLLPSNFHPLFRIALYLSKPRIERPVSLTLEEKLFFVAQIAEAEAEAEDVVIEEGSEGIGSRLGILTEKISFLKNVITPIRGVPEEVLSLIFQWYCNGASSASVEFNLDDDSSRTDLGRCLSRTTLTSVCAAWRRAAHAMPELWCNLHLNLLHQKSRDLPSVLSASDAEMVKEYLSRSGLLPLNLNIQLPYSASTEVVKALLPFCPRIQSLTLAAPLTTIIALLKPSSPSLPMLERLNLSLTSVNKPFLAFFPRKIHNLFGSNQLKSLHIVEADSLYSLADALVLPSPPRLETLSVNFYYARINPMVYTNIIIANSSSLVHVQIRFPLGVESASQNDNESVAITLPALRSLHLTSFFDFACDKALIRSITAPQLEALRIYRHSYSGENVSSLMRELGRFQQRSHAPLRSLGLFYLRCDSIGDSLSRGPAEEVIRVFELFPTIETLIMDSSHFNVTPLVKSLALTTEDSQILLPKLQKLELELNSRYCGNENLTEVMDMIQSRFLCSEQESSRFQDVRLIFTGYSPRHPLDEDLRKLEGEVEGFRIIRKAQK
ncbi:hypothetical protein BT96DRAFT_1009524 [Gymnopus androsaceus JB14]|uniref:F-box domain-containing protein n=1 Tax=Gymnopus androsaceus JB14 TaxID=1447944 RepID=A0A6A4GCE1_9AGAR|nr:hypothetical protein BT96DRAFT_1009524 [Gymnopus androsaceus JB14]